MVVVGATVDVWGEPHDVHISSQGSPSPVGYGHQQPSGTPCVQEKLTSCQVSQGVFIQWHIPEQEEIGGDVVVVTIQGV